jgi:arginine decarboxylase
VKKTLELHPLNDENYYLGAFLIGAYQEILGDLHNLLGDTNAVHVSLDHNGEVVLDHIIEGDTVSEVLSYVQFDPKEMISKFRRETEKAAREKRITLAESSLLLRFYIDGMNGYTYLEEPSNMSILAQATMPGSSSGNGNGNGNGSH